MKNEIETLKEFLNFPLWTSDNIFDKFKDIENSIYRENAENKLQRFLFLEGKKENKVVLVAHADTYFDEKYGFDRAEHQIIEDDGKIYNNDDNSELGIGADDRAGCAMLWILKELGHSILITDGEEHGRKGSRWLMEKHQDIAEIINSHQFMIQLDRRGSKDFKCYSVGSEEFRAFLSQETGYDEPNRTSYTDIVTLCTKICGVNFSVGYYNEHTHDEYIVIEEWYNTLEMLRKLLNMELPKFELNRLL